MNPMARAATTPLITNMLTFHRIHLFVGLMVRRPVPTLAVSDAYRYELGKGPNDQSKYSFNPLSKCTHERLHAELRAIQATTKSEVGWTDLISAPIQYSTNRPLIKKTQTMTVKTAGPKRWHLGMPPTIM